MGEYATCAHAYPDAPKVELPSGNIGHRASHFCKYALQYSQGRYKNWGTWLLTDLSDCDACPMYTRPDLYVTVWADRWEATIYLDRLIDLTQAQRRKLFKLIATYAWGNRKPAEKITAFLAETIDDLKAYEHLFKRPADKRTLEKWQKIQKDWLTIWGKTNL